MAMTMAKQMARPPRRRVMGRPHAQLFRDRPLRPQRLAEVSREDVATHAKYWM
jgi:hypothetical protein